MYIEDDITNESYITIKGQRFNGKFNQTVVRYRETCAFSGVLLSQGFGYTKEEAKQKAIIT